MANLREKHPFATPDLSQGTGGPPAARTRPGPTPGHVDVPPKSVRGREWSVGQFALFALFAALLLACERIVLAELDPKLVIGDGQGALAAGRGTVLILVGLPFFLAAAVSVFLIAPPRTGFGLRTLESWDAAAGRRSAAERQRVASAVRDAWGYERSRYQRSLRFVWPQALTFGLVTTVVLSACAVFLAWRTRNFLRAIDWMTASSLALSVGAAAAVAFAIHLGRILVRITSMDVTSRMFSWATRAVLLVVVADVGLFVVLQKASVPSASSYGGALLLGVITAILGDRAVDVLLDKGSKLVGVPAPKHGTASLRSLEGMTDEDADRFAEEGVHSIHDLAFAPTARLFFNTAHSLQRIVDWQDTALLGVYMGSTRAKALFDQMAIRGVVDLQGLAEEHLAAAGGAGPAVAPEGGQGGAGLRSARARGGPGADGKGKSGNHPSEKGSILHAVGKALGLEGPELIEALEAIEHDEVTMRLRVHFRSTPLSDEDEEEDEPQDGDRGLAAESVVATVEPEPEEPETAPAPQAGHRNGRPHHPHA